MRGKAFVLIVLTLALLAYLPYLWSGIHAPAVQSPFDQTPDGTLVADVDSDRDGLADGLEEQLGTDVHNPDSDYDAISDGDEYDLWHGYAEHLPLPFKSHECGNISVQPIDWLVERHQELLDDTSQSSIHFLPEGDLDGDGRVNIVDPDSDADGWTDSQELDKGTNAAHPDSDLDGVIDSRDPNPKSCKDEDHDGFPDDYEMAAGIEDPNGDDDLDGISNIEEYYNGTDPKDSFQPADQPLDPGVGNEIELKSKGLYEPGADLSRVVFRVKPPMDPHYWRLTDYDVYDGTSWSRARALDPLEDAYTGETLPSDGPEGFYRGTTRHTITFNGHWTGFLPVGLHTTTVSSLAPDGVLVLSDKDDTFVAQDPTDGYNFTAARYDISLNTLQPLRAGTTSDSVYLSKPYYQPTLKTMGDEIALTSGASSDFERAVALQQYLIATCKFNTSAPTAPADKDPIAFFLLTSKEGTSLEFSSAFVMLARYQDIPARLVVGYAPGIISHDSRYVLEGHKHAWGELFFAEVGWVAFEATPANADPTHGIASGASGQDTSVIGQEPSDPGTGGTYGLVPTKGGSGGGTTSGGAGPDSPTGPGGNGTPGAGPIDTTDPTHDADGDGIPDGEELINGTNPYFGDTDGDGLTDSTEKLLGTDPRNPDTDGDGLDDWFEGKLATDPLDPDTDSGGASDWEEWSGGTDPLDGADDHLSEDSDQDGVSDAKEIASGSDPFEADSDHDGIIDGEEVAAGTDPTSDDSDGDGLPDWLEAQLGTDPTEADTDGDGLADSLEVGQGLDPLRTDSDGDGRPDGVEYADPHLDPTQFTPPDPVDGPVPPPGDGGGGSDPPPTAPHEDESAPDLTPLLVVIVGCLAAVAGYLLWQRRHLGEMARALERAEKALGGLDDSDVDEVRASIFVLYRELTEILVRYGFLRTPAETIREFHKILAAALPDLPPQQLIRLNRIVEEARYSDHDLPEGYRTRAIDTVSSLRAALPPLREFRRTPVRDAAPT